MNEKECFADLTPLVKKTAEKAKEDYIRDIMGKIDGMDEKQRAEFIMYLRVLEKFCAGD